MGIAFTMAVPRQRVLDLMRVQCKVFNTTYNPERIRLGSRILHQRLRGPAVASYYPPRIGTISQLRSLYPEHQIIDEEEDRRRVQEVQQEEVGQCFAIPLLAIVMMNQ